MTIRKILPVVLVVIIFIALTGCESGTDGPPTTPVDTTKHKVEFAFKVKNFRQLRDGEYYSLWIKQRPDSGWKLVSDTNFNRFSVQDSIVIYGRINDIGHPDSIYEALVTIELTKHPVMPSPVEFLKGSVFQDTGYLTMNHLGDFSKAAGGLTFTSLSSDTGSHNREFYLMKFTGSTPDPSLTDLPQLNSGWRYGLWAVDYEFFPFHEFLYGLFDSPVGHDSDSMGDAFAFPGGAKQQRMDLSSGRIIVTLEPPLYGDSLRYKGAELLPILQFNRISAIERDRFYPMSNVSAEWLPSARVVFTKRR